MQRPAYFEEIRRRSSGRWDQLESDPELAGPWYQLFKQVQSPRHVLSELLQNADDAGATETSVRIENGVFLFTHNGEDFTEEHFASLCRFGYSNKRALHTIGFRGIGFKSTFSLGDVVELRSPTLAVAFERRRFTEPTWIDSPFGSIGSTSIRVAFASDHQRREVEKNLQEWLKSPVSLLFFNHIRRMRVGDQEVYWGSLGPGPVRDSQWMALHDDPNQSYLVAMSESEPFPEEALDEIRQERLLGVDDGTTFPPCRVEIVVGAKGRLYVVLPTGVETALPFACNAPFIQDPARLKIKDPETSPTNRWLLERVGQLAAKVLLEWLEPASGSVAARSDAYGVFPDVDRDDSSLEGTVAAIVEQSFDAEISGKPFLLTDAGELKPAGGSVIVPPALFDVWPGEQAAAVLDDAGRPAFSRHVSSTDRTKLLHWNVIEAFTKDAVLQSLRTKHLPKPESWRRLLNLWAYLAPELTDYRFQSIKQLVRIVPVQGKEVLYSANEVVRLGEKRLLQSDADWEFLAEHLLVLNQNWPRFLAEQRRVTDEGEGVAGKDNVEAASAVLTAIGLVEASDPGYVLERVAAEFFAQKSVSLEGCVQFAQIAAKLGASASKTFRYATRDRQLRAADHVVLFDIDGTLEASFPSPWATAHFLHESYSTFRSCTSEEWTRWVTSGRAGISTLAPLQSKREHLYGQHRLAAELKRRGFAGSTSNPYVTASFLIEDWDFDGSLWQHWDILAKDDPAFWGGLVERLLAQSETYWAKAKTARALQVATTGNTRPVTYDPILPAWILRLRDLPCLRDTRGVRRKPGELLRRTPETEPFLDVEFFVHALLDGEAVRPLLTLLGVRDTPTGPDRLIACLRALAQTDSPPIAEVEKWYRRLDQMIDTCSTADQASIQHAFHSEKLVFTESSVWVTSGGVYLAADEEDVPGAALVRASVRDLALWRKIGVEDRPTSDLAIRWLTELPTGKPLSQDDVRRVRALLTRHPVRIWNECGRWLNLAGEWVPVEGLTYALTMQSLVPWSHFHDWVKQATADLQRLGAEITDVHPFADLRRLADSVEDRLELVSLFPGTPQRKPWLNQLGSELRRIELDDNVEVERIRALAARLQDTVWLEGPELEMIPYIGGTPAGTPRRAEVVWMERTLHVVRRPAARLARAVSQELGRAFRRPDVADAIKLCFERSPEFVTEVVEENFTLASHVSTDEPRAQDTAEAGVDSPGDSVRGESTPSPDVEPAVKEILESPDEPEVNALDVDPGTDEPVHKEQPSTKPTRPPIIERFAHSQGFQKDGDDRFYHPDGSWIARTHGARFPWERRTAGGELVRSYWPKDHCLDLEPLQLEADLWSLIDKFPERYALVLASPNGQPIEVPGVGLRAMLEQGQLKIYPAAYRLVIGVQA